MNSDSLGLPLFYQEFPEYFDTPSNAYHSNEKNEVVEKLLHEQGVKTVLDMTCGTGSQVLYLAKHGYKVTGADFSPDLLTQARKKAKREGLSILFIDGDMRTLQIGEFDAVITIDNAIGHLVKEDFSLALRNIHKNLKVGGLYLFDILNLEAMTDSVVKADNERMTDKRETHDGTIIHNVRYTSIDRDKGLFVTENNFTIEKEKGDKQIQNTCSLQIYKMDELNALLSHNGFELVTQYKADAYTFKKDERGYSIMTLAKKR